MNALENYEALGQQKANAERRLKALSEIPAAVRNKSVLREMTELRAIIRRAKYQSKKIARENFRLPGF